MIILVTCDYTGMTWFIRPRALKIVFITIDHRWSPFFVDPGLNKKNENHKSSRMCLKELLNKSEYQLNWEFKFSLLGIGFD